MRFVLRAFVFAMLYLAGVVHGQTKQEGGLAISLARVVPVSPKPLFELEFRNGGEQPLTLTLGWGLGNGTRYADAVELSLADAQGKRSRLRLKEFAYAAGAVYVWRVPLDRGATFSLPVDLADYMTNGEKYTLDFEPGLYRLSATFKGVSVSPGEKSESASPLWTGMVVSNEVEFRVEVRYGFCWLLAE